MPKQSKVKLVIYDILGREVASLAEETEKAGSYQAVWKASRFADGVHFYKLETGD